MSYPLAPLLPLFLVQPEPMEGRKNGRTYGPMNERTEGRRKKETEAGGCRALLLPSLWLVQDAAENANAGSWLPVYTDRRTKAEDERCRRWVVDFLRSTYNEATAEETGG